MSVFPASRVEFYGRHFGRPLRLKFHNANLFSFLDYSPLFDIIWAVEAIFHIHPAERFLELASTRLAPGGKLVISDANTLNPKSWLDGIRLRGTVRHTPHRRFKDPVTGLAVEYAEERRFTVSSMVRKLEAEGFEARKVRMCGFRGTTILPPWLIRRAAPAHFMHTSQKVLQKTPLLNRLGSIYTIVAANHPERA